MTERTFKDLAVPVTLGGGLVEGACRSVAAGGLALGAPDAVAHVRVRGVGQAGLAEVAQEGLVLFDLPVAARQVQRHFLHVVNVAVADVPDLQPSGLDFLLQVDEVFEGGVVAAGGNVDPVDPDLPGELEVFGRSVGRDLERDLDAGSEVGERLAGCGGRGCQRGAGRAERSLIEGTSRLAHTLEAIIPGWRGGHSSGCAARL